MFSPLFIILRLLDLYSLLIFIWVMGSWIPQWRYQEWYRVIGNVVEPYVNLFRGLNLNFGGMDWSAFAAMVVLTLFGHVLASVMSGGMRL